MANGLREQGRIDDAIKHYEEALRIKPDYEEAHNNLAIALFRKGDIDGAIDHFQKALQINPNFLHAKNNLSKILALKKQMQ